MNRTKNNSTVILSDNPGIVKKQKDRARYIFLNVLIALKKKTQDELAKEAGVSESFISQIMWGTKTSAPTQESMARQLGYLDWDDLMAEQPNFIRRLPRQFKGE